MPKDILSDSASERAVRIRSRQKKNRGEQIQTKNLKKGNNSLSHSRIQSGPHFETQQGELVKSKGELLIANFLYSEGLKYAYERPIRLGKRIIVRPDFYLKRYDVFIEFWGMLNDEKYQRNSRWKVAHYERFGVKFIELEPKDLACLKERFYSKLEKVVGKNSSGK